MRFQNCGLVFRSKRFPRGSEKISWQAKAPAPPRCRTLRVNVGQTLSSVNLAISAISSSLLAVALWIGMSSYAFSQPAYDLLLQGGHVIDPKNGISAVRHVAIKDGAIAAVSEHLDPAAALKVVNVAGLYVTPGLVDIHAHVYTGTGERGSYAGDLSLC